MKTKKTIETTTEELSYMEVPSGPVDPKASMMQVGDLVRALDLGEVRHYGGVWLVIQIDSWAWSCQAIQGNKKEWFDINTMEVVTHD